MLPDGGTRTLALARHNVTLMLREPGDESNAFCVAGADDGHAAGRRGAGRRGAGGERGGGLADQPRVGSVAAALTAPALTRDGISMWWVSSHCSL